ncbi:MAG TPA: divalent-cation tolerance protein CutA [Thioalkalivibrio sp.]|mgnify:CR=1 FL=1|nr:divalent-cation tolerance protein CutA [Thioalkalivibrio sp.]
MTDALLVLTTHPDAEGAEALARTLVDERLAACVNVLPRMTSIYTWEGTAQRGEEHQLFIKTRAAAFDPLKARLCELHPYDVPELIAVPVTHGLAAYLNWIDESTT